MGLIRHRKRHRKFWELHLIHEKTAYKVDGLEGMYMKIFDSNNISEIDYDNGTLTVRFTNNTVYKYFDVPERTYHGLLNAVSKGRYFATFIKGHYAYRKV